MDLPASGAQDSQCFQASTSDKYVSTESIMCPKFFLSTANIAQDLAKERHNRTGNVCRQVHTLVKCY